MNSGKVKLSSEGAQAVREVVDNANAGQGDCHPEDHAKGLLAGIHFPELCGT
jgi:hypothetical protein